LATARLALRLRNEQIEIRDTMRRSRQEESVASLPKQRSYFYEAEFRRNYARWYGQVGGAAVTELLAIPECREVVVVTRKPIAARSRVRNVVVDTGTADFAKRTAALAREVLSQGSASAVSCVGVGSGSRR